jgi:hypothetical protein
VKPLARVACWLSPLVTTTSGVASAEPTAICGKVAVMVVESTTTTLVAATPPTLTLAVGETKKSVPVMVTAVVDIAGPDAGETPVTVGATGPL